MVGVFSLCGFKTNNQQRAKRDLSVLICAPSWRMRPNLHTLFFSETYFSSVLVYFPVFKPATFLMWFKFSAEPYSYTFFEPALLPSAVSFFLQITFKNAWFGKCCVCSKLCFLKASSCWRIAFSESVHLTIIAGHLDFTFPDASSVAGAK